VKIQTPNKSEFEIVSWWKTPNEVLKYQLEAKLHLSITLDRKVQILSALSFWKVNFAVYNYIRSLKL